MGAKSQPISPPFGHKAGLPPSKKYLLVRQPHFYYCPSFKSFTRRSFSPDTHSSASCFLTYPRFQSAGMKALSPRARADRSELIFSAQPNALKRWQRAYYKTFSWFLPGLWADGRRSFPGTQLAFSIWVPGPLLTPYSQSTCSIHRNPSNSQYIRAARITASLYAQSPECLIAKRGATSHARPDT